MFYSMELEMSDDHSDKMFHGTVLYFQLNANGSISLLVHVYIKNGAFLV